MITLICLTLFVLEARSLFQIVSKYSKDHNVDEFIANATIEDIFRVRHHSVTGWIMLCMATIASVWKF